MIYSILALEAKTDNAPESFHRGVVDRLPPNADNLNMWISALEAENERQNTKYIQAKNGIKKYAPSKKQQKLYESLRTKALNWGTMGTIEYLEQFANIMTMPTEHLEQPKFEPTGEFEV